LARQLYTAHLDRKLLISERAQCFHLEFSVPELGSFEFIPGQFVSTVAADNNGKQQTRAYSIASAPHGNTFSLCVNRVEGGFFSNLLCDLEPGSQVQFHGPHGLFTLRQPLTDSVFIATGTGIAPMLAFVEHLFPEKGDDRNDGRQVWLVYGTRHETEIYYQEYFEKVAADRPDFHYLCTLSRGKEDWNGLRGYVQDHVARVLIDRDSANHSGPVPTIAEGAGFDIHAYICGLNDMVSGNRDRLTERGWQKKQIIFERYD
jgi:ferredoxin-NADP reductase